MKLKIVCLTLVMSMVLVMFSGCKSATSSKTGNADNGKPMEMTVRMFYHGEIDASMAKNNIDYNNNKIANFHREHSGVKVTFQPALADTAQETQKKAMILASNDVPDLMDVSRDEYFKYGMQGVLSETESYLKTMADYTKLAGKEVMEALRYKGKLFGFASVLEESDLNRTHSGGILVRKDILDKLGIATPKTIDDFYKMWKTVKEKTGLIPLTSAGDGFAAIKAAYRVALDYKLNGDKMEYIWVQPEFKEYLTFMNKLYKEQLLDKEYITTNATALTEKFMSDKAFSTNQGWAYACVNIRDIGKKITNATVAFMPQPTGPNGQKALLYNNWPVQRIWVIPTAAKNKAAAAKFMNYMATPESKMVQDYGIEGEDYTKGSDGKPQTTTEKQMNVTWKICYEVMATPASFKVRLVSKGYDWAYNQALEAQKGADMTTNILTMLPPDTEFQKLEQRLALKTFVTEQVTKFIIGDRQISDFDNFVKELKSKGLDEQTEALNKWYKANKK